MVTCSWWSNVTADPGQSRSGLFTQPFVIGEVAQAHDGSLGTAHAFIQVIADAGAHGVKFQMHIAAAESRRDEPWRIQFSPQDSSRYEYWRRMEFSAEQWSGLREHALDLGLAFIVSPFSLQAVDILEDAGGVTAWKVASGEVANTPLLRRIAASRTPVVVSSGLSAWEELDAAVTLLRDADAEYAVVQCTSRYPTRPEDVGLNVIGEMAQRYGCPVGLSDHSGSIWPSLAAQVLGATIFEVHVTLSRHGFGPDQVVSLIPVELGDLVRGLAFNHRALRATVDKREVPEDLVLLRTTFGRSIVTSRDLPAGTVLAPGDLTLKKPGGGLAPRQLDAMIGRTLRTDLAADKPLQENDLI